MIDVRDVYILKVGLFSGYLGLPQSEKVKFLIKSGDEFVDLDGQKVSLFKSGKVIGGFVGECEFCDYLSEDAVLYKLFDEKSGKINVQKAFGAEGFDMSSFKRTAKFDAVVYKYLLKPFVCEFEFRGEKCKWGGYKASRCQGIEMKTTVKGGYRKSMLRAIEEFYSKFQSVKDKSRKVDVIKSGNGELQELGM